MTIQLTQQEITQAVREFIADKYSLESGYVHFYVLPDGEKWEIAAEVTIETPQKF